MTKMAKPIPQGAGFMAIVIAAVAVFLVIALSKAAMNDEDPKVLPSVSSSGK